MELPEMTREELLKMLPKMDLRNDARPNEGEMIEARKAAEEVLAYERFLGDPSNNNIKDQTFAVGFNTRKLISWLQQQADGTDTVHVYLSMEANRFNVIFWPYNAGLPTVKQEGKQDGATLSSPYNIGGRRP